MIYLTLPELLHVTGRVKKDGEVQAEIDGKPADLVLKPITDEE